MVTQDRSVAVIGGGLAGLSAARGLLQQGTAVEVYDMGKRGPGGRSSTRRVDHEGSCLQFDHGCQFIRASDSTVQENIKEWEEKGYVRQWEGRLGLLDAHTGTFTERSASGPDASPSGFCGIMSPGEIYVGVPSMDAVCKGLAAHPNLQSHWGSKVTGISRLGDEGWEVQYESGREATPATGLHSAVILADVMTVRQGSPGVLDLGEAGASPVIQQLRTVTGSPVFSLMVCLERSAVNAPFDGSSVAGCDVIQWVARDSSKPGRERSDGLECWVAMTTEAFAQQLLAEAPLTKNGAYVAQSQQYLSDVAPRIWEALWRALQPFSGLERPTPVYMHAQRWGSGFKANLLPNACLIDRQLGLAACGDFCVESSAQGAVLSGLAAAQALREALGDSGVAAELSRGLH
ncbi:Renalase [Coccomyxa sp. Obi]|nr:Renalase [Coccomyxa sp. Obi]